MRFRVPNNGGQQAADGVGNFFRSLAMAPMYEAQAAQQAQDAGLKRDLTQSQIGVHLADAAIKEQERKTLAGRPDILSLMGATRAGMSVPEFQAGLSERTQGAPVMGPPVLSAPIEGVGPSGRTSAFDDAILSLYGPAMATPADKTNWDQLAKARGEYQDQGAMGDALAAANGGDYMKSSALSAVRGKKEFTPFKEVGNTGTALNQITGEQPVVNPALRNLFDEQGRALIGQRDSAARASNASAAHSYASASKVNQEKQQGARSGDIVVVPGPDGSVQLVNKVTGQARNAVGADGVPVQGKGPPVKAMPGSAAKGHLENLTNLRRAETALALINGDEVGSAVGDKNATGWKGLVPNSILNRVDPSGVDTRAAIADLGSLVIHDRSGAAVTASEFPRLAPFIPTAYDDPATVKKKLAMFVTNYRAIVDDSAGFYREMGYTVPELSGAAKGATSEQTKTPDPLGLRR